MSGATVDGGAGAGDCGCGCGGGCGAGSGWTTNDVRTTLIGGGESGAGGGGVLATTGSGGGATVGCAATGRADWITGGAVVMTAATLGRTARGLSVYSAACGAPASWVICAGVIHSEPPRYASPLWPTW